MEDLKDHIGTVVVVVGAMWALLIAMTGVIWKQLKDDLKKFPDWLEEMEKRGGVVTHHDLIEEGPLMTVKTHDVACAKIIGQIMDRISISEVHQKELMDVMDSKFQAVFDGQAKLIQRLSDLQDSLLRKLAGMKNGS